MADWTKKLFSHPLILILIFGVMGLFLIYLVGYYTPVGTWIRNMIVIGIVIVGFERGWKLASRKKPKKRKS